MCRATPILLSAKTKPAFVPLADYPPRLSVVIRWGNDRIDHFHILAHILISFLSWVCPSQLGSCRHTRRSRFLGDLLFRTLPRVLHHPPTAKHRSPYVPGYSNSAVSENETGICGFSRLSSANDNSRKG